MPASSPFSTPGIDFLATQLPYDTQLPFDGVVDPHPFGHGSDALTVKRGSTPETF